MRIVLILAMLLAVSQAAIAKTLTILALGDSLTAGLGLSPEESFPARLEQALRAKGLEVDVINAGVSGDIAEAGLARLDWALTDEVDAIIVELGANDALRGLEPAQTEKALDQILSRATARRLPVLLAGMRAPRNLGQDYITRFDSIYERLAQKHGVLVYPFFLEGVAASPELNQPDGLHPSSKGVEVIVNNILSKVTELVHQAGERN
jgi:acyl-CoA thioesterase-1